MSMLAELCHSRARPYQNVYANTRSLFQSGSGHTVRALKVEKFVHSVLHDTPKNIFNYSPRMPAARPHTTSSTGSQTLSVVQAATELPSCCRPGADSSVAFASVSSSPSQSGSQTSSRKRTCQLRQEAAPEPGAGARRAPTPAP